MLIGVTVAAIRQYRGKKPFLVLVVCLVDDFMLDFRVAVQAFCALLVNMNLVIMRNQVEREGLFPISKKPLLVVTTLAISARHNRVLLGSISMARDTIHLSRHHFGVIHHHGRCLHAGGLTALSSTTRFGMHRDLALRRSMTQQTTVSACVKPLIVEVASITSCGADLKMCTVAVCVNWVGCLILMAIRTLQIVKLRQTYLAMM